jgi:large subunit ribosomal protein L23
VIYYDIIRRPVVSEKAYAGMERGVYSFWVDPRATKIEIKTALQQMFGVTVIGINTMNIAGKRKRVGRFTGHRVDRKKAIVRLAEGQKIEALGSMA